MDLWHPMLTSALHNYSESCFDTWYKIRLIEWGISGPIPSANFQHEIDLVAPLPHQNSIIWYSGPQHHLTRG
jgi:hypothetical protein